MENDEKLAHCIHNIVHLASKVPLSDDNNQYYKRLTGENQSKPYIFHLNSET